MTTTILTRVRAPKDPGEPGDRGGPEAPARLEGPGGPGGNTIPLAEMAASARTASRFLKALSNPNRLLLLCLLAEGEMTVSALEAALGLRQPAISQQLARLRAEGLIAGRRDGKSIHYRLASDQARRIMVLLYELFCEPESDDGTRKPEAGNSVASRSLPSTF